MHNAYCGKKTRIINSRIDCMPAFGVIEKGFV